MLLFYSDHCAHCRMLLVTIKRYDPQGKVRLVSVDALRAAGRGVPPQVHSVPCLLVRDERRYLYGKQVFDFLLLPTSGKLVGGGPAPGGPEAPAAPREVPGEPAAFALGPAGFSDTFAGVALDEAAAPDDRAFAWSSLDSGGAAEQAPVEIAVCEETRSKKTLPDLDAIRALRDSQLTEV